MKQDPFSLTKGGRSRCFSIGHWERFLDVRAGFTRRLTTKDKSLIMESELSVLSSAGFSSPPYTISQVHGKHVDVVEKENMRAHFNADALVTSQRGVPLALHYADCVPVYFFDPATFSVGVAHAGWRGTALHICREVIHVMKNTYGTHSQHMLAAVGPSIKPCCYEVRGAVYSAFENVFSKKALNKIFKRKSRESWMCDLCAANKEILMSSGVPEKNILLSARCTYCETKNFYSYRRDRGKTGRMMAFIGLL